MKIIISMSKDADEAESEDKLVDLDSRDPKEDAPADDEAGTSDDEAADDESEEAEPEESGDAAQDDAEAEPEEEDTEEGDTAAPEDTDAEGEGEGDADTAADADSDEAPEEAGKPTDDTPEEEPPAEDKKAAPAKAKAPADDRKSANDVRLPDNGPTVIKKPSNPVFFNTNNQDLIRKRGLAFLGSYLINTPSVGNLQRVTYADNPEGRYVIVVYGTEAVRVPYNDISATDAFADAPAFLAFLRSYGALPAIFRRVDAKPKGEPAAPAEHQEDPQPVTNAPKSPTSRQEIKDDLDVANADK